MRREPRARPQREKLRPLLARTNVTLFINQAVRLVTLRVADLLRPWSVKAYLGRRAGGMRVKDTLLSIQKLS